MIMNLTCTQTLAFRDWLDQLSAEQALELVAKISTTEDPSLPNEITEQLEQCDKLQLLTLIRDRVAAISDDDLVLIAGGEKVVGKIVAAATIPVAAGVAVGVAGGVAAGTAASLGYLGGTNQL